MHPIDTITLLNRLIVVSKDGERALRAASDEAYHEELKDSLMEYSHFFSETADELQEAVRNMGGKPAGLGTFDNTLHRFWLHLKVTALGRDEAEILDGVESDERRADLLFDDALRWEMPPEIHALVERRAEGASSRHHHIHELRERLPH